MSQFRSSSSNSSLDLDSFDSNSSRILLSSTNKSASAHEEETKEPRIPLPQYLQSNHLALVPEDIKSSSVHSSVYATFKHDYPYLSMIQPNIEQQEQNQVQSNHSTKRQRKQSDKILKTKYGLRSSLSKSSSI